jgi:hypothetical protein
MYAPSYKSAIVKSGNKAIEQKPVMMDLYNLKTSLDALGFSFALRQYIPTRMQSPKVCICYEDWDKAIKLDQPKIFPELQINNPYYSLKNIYESFKLYVRYQRDNRGEIRIKRDLAKMKGKYKFDN